MHFSGWKQCNMAVIRFVLTSWFTQKYFLVSLYLFVIGYLFQ